jgi:hypothetical protein
MTHEELLTRLDKQVAVSKVIGCECSACDNAVALRAVVELHKPAKHSEMNEFADEGIGCSGCGYDFDYAIWTAPYPCPTIQTIEKELS